MAKRSAASNTAVWIIIGLLAFAMVGFGASGLSGTARSLGTVGDKQIAVQQYYTVLNNAVRRVQQQFGRTLSPADIQASGIDQQALASLISQRALDQAATDLGVSIGDENLRNQIIESGAFSNLTGQFDRAAYTQALQRSGLSEQDYETSIREAAARDILTRAVVGDITPPTIYADTLIGFLAERRDFSWARLTQSDITTGIPVPTDADLRAYYDTNSDDFIDPAAKRLAYVWVTPDMVLDDILIDPSEVRALYNSRADIYNTPEMRIVDRLIFPDQAAAQTAIDAIQAGTSDFEQAVETRGLTVADVALGDVTLDDLGNNVGAAVFAPTEPGVIGPVDTTLGPALFRITAILTAQNTPFTEVEDELREELARDVAERDITVQAEAINDLLAGGATLADVAGETPLILDEIDWSVASETGIAAYDEFSTVAAEITADDFPELLTLSDGGVFAVEFITDVPAVLRPFETEKAAVQAAWMADAAQRALQAEAEVKIEGLGDQQLSSLGLVTARETDLERTEFIDGTPPALLSTAFEMAIGETRVVTDAGSIILVQLTAINPPNLEQDETQSLRTILTNALAQDLQQSMLDGFAQGVQSTLDVDINQQRVNSVVSQITGVGR
ncbi:MAG: SurA N-terminal domain-containing protein [Pseudomonadota bacterium]